MDRDACWEWAEMEGGDRSRDVCSSLFCQLHVALNSFHKCSICGCVQFAHQTAPEWRTQPSAVITAPWALLQAS